LLKLITKLLQLSDEPFVFNYVFLKDRPKELDMAKENAKAGEEKDKDPVATERVTTDVTFANLFSSCLNLSTPKIFATSGFAFDVLAVIYTCLKSFYSLHRVESIPAFQMYRSSMLSQISLKLKRIQLLPGKSKRRQCRPRSQ